ncbi:hypothetical protein [Flavisericum labens]|uniref:hypothetical protein n=1 Tax=Flavisericum labens TaxID=3377112 RepID=UPI00387AA44B
MKTLKKQIKLIAELFALFVILQSCTVYKSTNVTLDRAVQNQSKVKVVAKNNKIDKFYKVTVEDGHYYGIKRINGKTLKFPLNQEYIQSIKEKDKTTSTILTIALPVVVIVTAILISVEPFKWDLVSLFSDSQ